MRFLNEEVRTAYHSLPLDLQVFMQDFSSMLAKIEMIIFVDAVKPDAQDMLDVEVRITNKFHPSIID